MFRLLWQSFLSTVCKTKGRHSSRTMSGFMKNACPWFCKLWTENSRSEEHTSELQSHRDLHSFPTRRSSDLSLYLRVDFGHDEFLATGHRYFSRPLCSDCFGRVFCPQFAKPRAGILQELCRGS